MDHFYEHIPGWFQAAHLYKSMVERARDGSRFVEVGAWKGRSAAFMAVEIVNSGKKIEFHVVDWFKGSDEAEHRTNPAVREGRLREEFEENIRTVAGVLQVHAMSSLAAAALFANESLDFVFIDASHDYASVHADILAWLPKVRTGGVLAGDDYGVFPGVDCAVEELLPEHENPKWPLWTYVKVWSAP
jgi:Methyltransferase domain